MGTHASRISSKFIKQSTSNSIKQPNATESEVKNRLKERNSKSIDNKYIAAGEASNSGKQHYYNYNSTGRSPVKDDDDKMANNNDKSL